MNEQQEVLQGLDVAPWVGITTVTKEALHPGEGLIRWAHRIGLEGKSMDDVRAKRKGEGTGLHASLELLIRGHVDPATPQEVAFAQWWGGFRAVGATLHATERPIEDRVLRVRGRVDLLAQMEPGHLRVIDVKSGKSIYRDAHFQVAGYVEALIEEYAHSPDHYNVNHVDGGVLLLTAEGDAIFERTTITTDEWRALVTVYRAITRLA